MRERKLCWWTCGKRANGRKAICRERFTWEKELSSGTLNSACRTRVRRSCFIAAEVFVRRSRRTICRGWATQTWNRWMGVGKAGPARDFPLKKAEAEERSKKSCNNRGDWFISNRQAWTARKMRGRAENCARCQISAGVGSRFLLRDHGQKEGQR